MIEQIGTPFFVKRYKPEQGGNDFLGLRAVNTNLMAQCLPGINNVTAHVRPFSLIAWIYWKFYHLASEQRLTSPTSDDLSVWQEKIEILFTWSHVLHGIDGIPGTRSAPPDSGSVPLNFDSWKRQRSSTSLMAAVQYGPPSKAPDGLGFIEQTESGLFRSTGLGNELASALEKELEGVGRRKLLRSLSGATARANEVSELYEHWSIESPSAKERTAFWSAFYSESAIGSQTRTGNRSATVYLIWQALHNAKTPLTVEQVREHVFHGMVLSARVASITGHLVPYWHRWICLQLRQAQRLSLETILGWIERYVKDERIHDPSLVSLYIDSVWSKNGAVLEYGPTVLHIRKTLGSTDLEALLRHSRDNKNFSIFHLMGEMQERFGNYDELAVIYALRTLFLCAEFTRALSDLGTIDSELNIGGAERLSLKFWLDSLTDCSDLGPLEFVVLLLEQHIISQHLSVAARRFDGGTQRLRLSIEEEGLTVLATDDLPLRVTPDRLFTALTLMAECKKIRLDKVDWTFTCR